MQTLVVATEYPWPADNGSRLCLLPTTVHDLRQGWVTHVDQAATRSGALAGP
jgi:hypothetical protein